MFPQLENCSDNDILVSIITVNYNGKVTLPRLLRGVSELLNFNPDFEHIIIDGLSTDGSVCLLRKHSFKHKNVNLVSERDHGIFEAMNKGVRLARGKYFIHLNSDDLVINHKLWKVIATKLRQKSAPLILTTPVRIVRDELTLRVLPSRPYSKLHRRFGYHFPHQGTFFSHHLFHRIGGYSTSIGYIADKIFCYQLLDALEDSQINYFDEEIAVQYAGGISSSSSFAPIKTFFLALMSSKKVKYRNPYIRAFSNPIFKLMYMFRRQK